MKGTLIGLLLVSSVLSGFQTEKSDKTALELFNGRNLEGWEIVNGGRFSPQICRAT